MVRVRLPAAAICLIVVTMVPAISLSQTSRGQTTATATFAAGCFWCVEEAFDGVAGVLTTTSGYIDGQTKDPTYEQVSSGNTGHTEALEVVYDPAKVTYEQLLQTFWRNVDAVDAGGQFCGSRQSYCSGMELWTSPEVGRAVG